MKKRKGKRKMNGNFLLYVALATGDLCLYQIFSEFMIKAHEWLSKLWMDWLIRNFLWRSIIHEFVASFPPLFTLNGFFYKRVYYARCLLERWERLFITASMWQFILQEIFLFLSFSCGNFTVIIKWPDDKIKWRI